MSHLCQSQMTLPRKFAGCRLQRVGMIGRRPAVSDCPRLPPKSCRRAMSLRRARGALSLRGADQCDALLRMGAGEHLFSARPGVAQRNLPGRTAPRVIRATRSTRPQIGHDGRASSAAAGL